MEDVAPDMLVSFEGSLEPAALVEACAAGGVLIVSRAPHRTAGLFSAELHAAAARASVPPEALRTLSPGLVLLAPSSSGGVPEPAQRRLLACLASLGGVRLCGELLCAAASPSELIKRARPVGRPWRLEYEVHYPAAEHQVIPFTRLHGTPSLIIGLHAALGPGYMDTPDEPAASSTEAAAAAEPLTLLHCKNGTLLFREWTVGRDMCDAASAMAPAAASHKLTARLAEVSGDGGTVGLQSTWALPWWVTPWTVRTFSFSASLDPLIAIAALNLAACTHLSRLAARGDSDRSGASGDGGGVGGGDSSGDSSHGGNGSGAEARGRCGQLHAGPVRGLRVYDPCTGSGTMLAAALAHGATAAFGSDVRLEFLRGARGNLEALGYGVALEASEDEEGEQAVAAPDETDETLDSRGDETDETRYGRAAARVAAVAATTTTAAAAAAAAAAASIRSDVGIARPAAVSCHLFVHDATTSFSLPVPTDASGDAPLPRRPTDGCDLVVSNPPWGKRFGKPEDGTPIVLSTVRQLPPSTTMLWLVNKSTRQALEVHPDVIVLQVIRLGGVDAVLMHGVAKGGEEEGQPRGQVVPPQLSKRQQKKMWAASRAAELSAESLERTDGGGGGSKQLAPKDDQQGGAAGRKRDRGCADF
jgi:hypothetical protein